MQATHAGFVEWWRPDSLHTSCWVALVKIPRTLYKSIVFHLLAVWIVQFTRNVLQLILRFSKPLNNRVGDRNLT